MCVGTTSSAVREVVGSLSISISVSGDPSIVGVVMVVEGGGSNGGTVANMSNI